MNPGTAPSRPHREFQTAEQYVYAYLRGRILSGKLRGSARLNQETIARELQVSRMPVREAIKRLDSEGLVVNRPNRGAVVTALGPDAILELFEMRSVLEGLAVSLAIPFFDAGVMDGIEERLTRLERAQGNLTTWMQRHDELHHHICRLSRRARLVAAVQNLRQTVAPYIRLHISAYTQQLEMPGFEHRTLVSAIKRGDPSTVEQVMREHIMAAAHGVVSFLREGKVGPLESARPGTAADLPNEMTETRTRKERP